MIQKFKSFGLDGIEGFTVDTEVDFSKGLPSFMLVGLPDASVKESRERVAGAIKNSGFRYPTGKITVNLAPAEMRKEGAIFDIAIALGIVAAGNDMDTAENGAVKVAKDTDDKNIKNGAEDVTPKSAAGKETGSSDTAHKSVQENIHARFAERAAEFGFIGELGLDGEVRRVNGVLPILLSAAKLGIKKVILPAGNAEEAGFADGLEIWAAKSLREVISFLQGDETALTRVERGSYEKAKNNLPQAEDLKYVKGQYIAKRALEIAAAGGHNILLVGPPGSGKTMLAKCFATILPEMTAEERLESTKIHSVAGTLDEAGIVVRRPFRTPHHTASKIALVGGGLKARPGEISLAHNGVLFLDELPEYPRASLEVLRQPLEDNRITVARANAKVDYPASFTLIASMNPCPCGHFGSRTQKCTCTASMRHKYLHKLSGPLMDRIDLHIEADGVTYNELSSAADEEPSSAIKARAEAARALQVARFAGSGVFCNAKMTQAQIKKFCALDAAGEKVLSAAFDKLQLSARAYSRILKVARTIADLDGAENIAANHVTEAVGYRTLDRKYEL